MSNSSFSFKPDKAPAFVFFCKEREKAATEPLQNKYKRFQTIAQERKIEM